MGILFQSTSERIVSQVAPVDKLSVAFAIILAVIFLKETITLKGVIGAVLIIAEIIVLIF